MELDQRVLDEMADLFVNAYGELEIYYDEEEQEFNVLMDEDVNDLYDPELAEEIRSTPERYLKVPSVTDSIRYGFMCDFVDELPVGRAKKMMQDALDDVSSFERFEEYMTGLGLEDDWNRYYGEKCIAYLREWYENREEE
ncbi:MAG: UPF0158 family protein [Lachnospiraceae bacterium]|nr:UPF0158 family protein [Lachnospiraceae bacterium]